MYHPVSCRLTIRVWVLVKLRGKDFSRKGAKRCRVSRGFFFAVFAPLREKKPMRKGRASQNVAKFVFEWVKQREGVETELIDICELKFPGDDAGDTRF